MSDTPTELKQCRFIEKNKVRYAQFAKIYREANRDKINARKKESYSVKKNTLGINL